MDNFIKTKDELITITRKRINEIEETMKLYDLGIAERKIKKKKLIKEIKTLELNKNKLKKRKENLKLRLVLIELD